RRQARSRRRAEEVHRQERRVRRPARAQRDRQGGPSARVRPRAARPQDRAGPYRIRRKGQGRLRDRASRHGVTGAEDRSVDGEMTWLLAHGIGGIRDLPVPRYVFFYGAAGVLVVSFAALAFLWRRPVLAQRAAGKPLPEGLLRVLLGVPSVALLVFLWLGALVGRNNSGVNLTPTFVYVYFWIGMPLVVAVLGNIWSVLSPWKAAADGAGRLTRREGPPFEYPSRLGRWPAALLLLAFAAIELTYTNPSDPRALALAIAIYSAITWF